MKYLNVNAAKVFGKLIEQLKEENYVKIDNGGKSFMPVSIENLGKAAGLMGVDMEIYSLAHYYEQNGDLMADPEMVFYVHSHNKHVFVFPGSFRQDNLGIYQQSISCQNDSWKYNKEQQADQAEFANMWLKNIEFQQEL